MKHEKIFSLISEIITGICSHKNALKIFTESCNDTTHKLTVMPHMADYRKLAEELLGMPIDARQRELFVREFVPAPPDGLISDRVMANVEQARTAVRAILASETTAGVAHTAYGLVQAAGEYLDHVRGARSWESRLNRTMMRPEPLKAKALRLVRSIAND